MTTDAKSRTRAGGLSLGAALAGALALLAPDDADALAACLDTALRLPPETLAQMGARGRAHVTARFTARAMLGSTLDVYDELPGARLTSF